MANLKYGAETRDLVLSWLIFLQNNKTSPLAKRLNHGFPGDTHVVHQTFPRYMLLGILHRLRMTYRGDDVANLVTKHLDTFGGLKFPGANG